MTIPNQNETAGGVTLPGTPDQSQPTTTPDPTSRRSQLRGLWIALALSALVLVLLLIFILENGQHVDIAYFGAHGHLPLGVALLFAAVFGNLVVLIPWAGRAMRLRAASRRSRTPRRLRRRGKRTPPVQ